MIKDAAAPIANTPIWLTAPHASLAISAGPGASARIAYWGPHIGASGRDAIPTLLTRQHAPGSPAEEVAGTLLNESGGGFAGAPGFLCHRDGLDWAPQFLVTDITDLSEASIELRCADVATQISVIHRIELCPETGVMSAQSTIINDGSAVLSIDHCAALCLPVDPRLTRLISFTGRWAGEFQTEEIARFQGSYLRENRAGRTSHDRFPGLIAAADITSEQNGPCYGYHLGWSGNHTCRLETLSDGRAFLQMGAYLLPGEIRLESGARYVTPVLYSATSTEGFSGLSQAFQAFSRSRRSTETPGPRPIHYNTWEAVYFDLSEPRLFELADQAAKVGAERFVLDDGWFGGRRNDRAGLGDWLVSADVFPNGLAPLIERVKGHSMTFGLWVEPEMVNPDSDLYRAHPDWVLSAPGRDQIGSRNQLVLDLTRSDVTEYLFERLDALLSEYEISYLKWDMNRNIHHPGSNGRAVASAQITALYALIDRIRIAHPDIEIESCASGGGRADYGILARTDRIWTSDSNDALDRQLIQKGASHFFPPERLGCHVGPAKCHITGRTLSMELRVATAFFGHMGLELNLSDETETDIATLTHGIALHKQHRDLIHSGRYYRLETDTASNALSIVAQDQSEALLSWCNLTSQRNTLPGRVHFVGLDPTRAYRVRIVWPNPVRSISSPSILEALDLGGDGLLVSGELLMSTGLQLPLLHPETCLIFHCKSEQDHLPRAEPTRNR